MARGEEDEPQLQTEKKQIVNLSSDMRKFISFPNFWIFFHSHLSGGNYLFWLELSGVDRYQDALKHLPGDSGKWGGQVHVLCFEPICSFFYYFCTLSTCVFLSNCLASTYIYRLSLVPVATSLASLMQWRVLPKSANLHTKGPQMCSPPLWVSSTTTAAPAVVVLCSQQALLHDHSWWGVGLQGGVFSKKHQSWPRSQ